MRTAVILQGALLMLSLFERSSAQDEDLAQDEDPLQHVMKYCNRNRDCNKKAICYTNRRGDCPHQNDEGQCFHGMCTCKSNHNLMYPACEFEQPEKSTEGPEPEGTKPTAGPDRCNNRCTERYTFCNDHGNCECRFGGLWPQSCCLSECQQGEVCNNGKCGCKGKQLDNGQCSSCPSCRRGTRCNEEEGVCRDFWPCRDRRKCGIGGTCEIRRRREVCRACGRGRRRLIFFDGKCYRPRQWKRLCVRHCGRVDKKAKCEAESDEGLICVACGEGFKLVENSEGRYICAISAKWSEWGSWGKCSVTCGGSGVVTRTRKCSESNKCSGEASETKHCPPLKRCDPFTQWTEWSQCSVTCGHGVLTRSRTCTDKICETLNMMNLVFNETKTCEKPTCCDASGPQGPRRSKDFHSSQPESNLFKYKCEGGCMFFTKVVHNCDGKGNGADELFRVRQLCDGKEECEFKPAPSFFGHRACHGTKKTWIHWHCRNAKKEFSYMRERL